MPVRTPAAVTLQNGDRSVGEVALLKQVGAGAADPNIRKILSQETRGCSNPIAPSIDKLTFWRAHAGTGHRRRFPEGGAAPASQNVAEGKPATEGETPIIERSTRRCSKASSEAGPPKPACSSRCRERHDERYRTAGLRGCLSARFAGGGPGGRARGRAGDRGSAPRAFPWRTGFSGGHPETASRP